MDGLQPDKLSALYSFVSNPGSIQANFLGLVDLSKPSIILALLAGAFQFWQTRMLVAKKPPTAVAKTSGAKDAAILASMNKSMVTFMPIMTVVIGVSLPGGLTLYWVAVNLISIAQQYLVFRKKKKSDPERAIIDTVAWFAVVSSRSLFLSGSGCEARARMGLKKWKKRCTSSVLASRLQKCDGFYTLLDLPLDRWIVARQKGWADAIRKMRKLSRARLYLNSLPSVEAVYAVNTLAWHQTSPNSDIDLLIVTQPGMLWTTRFLCVLPFALMKKRPDNGHQIQDPFCFSFFISSDALAMQRFQLSDEDPYLVYWTRSVIPIVASPNVLTHWPQANEWAKKFLPHAIWRGSLRPHGTFSHRQFVLVFIC